MNRSTMRPETPPLSVTPIPRHGIPGFSGFLLHLVLTISALMIPLGVTHFLGVPFMDATTANGLSLVYLIILLIYFWRTPKTGHTPTRKVSRGVTPMMIAASLFFYYFLGSLLPAAILFALIFVIGEGAMFLSTATGSQRILFPIVPLLAYGVTLFLFGRYDIALLSLIPFPAAMVLAAGTRSSAGSDKGMTRVGVICLTSLVFGATLLGLTAWFLYQRLGTLRPSVLFEQLNILREKTVAALVSIKLNIGGKVSQPLLGKEDEVANIVNGIINTLPGTLVALINFVSAMAQMVTLSGLRAYGFETSVSQRVREFRISVVSAVMFVLAWIVALVAVGKNTSSTMVGTIAENLTIVLMPGLALAGFFRFLRSMAKKGRGPGCFIFLIFLLVPFLLLSIPMILAFYEVALSIFGPIFAKLKHPNDKDQTPPSPKRSKKQGPPTDEELFEQYCQEQAKQRGEAQNDHDRHEPSDQD